MTERQKAYGKKHIYPIEPVAKPRMTRRDKWLKPARKPVQKYRWFCEIVRAYRVELPLTGACVTFKIPMPESWSEKKKAAMNGLPHDGKGDVDNFLKALLDVLFDNDKDVWDVRIRKVWAKTGSIEIEV